MLLHATRKAIALKAEVYLGQRLHCLLLGVQYWGSPTLLSDLSAERRGDNAMARTYRELAIEKMSRTRTASPTSLPCARPSTRRQTGSCSLPTISCTSTAWISGELLSWRDRKYFGSRSNPIRAHRSSSATMPTVMVLCSSSMQPISGWSTLTPDRSGR